ncbi:MAG: FeoB small GTPase domain-containing protein [Planctomycetota bacterium]
MKETVATRDVSETPERQSPSRGLARVVLVGHPNVGKSALFNVLTGSYVIISNYPGTTVDISRGRLRHERGELEVVDTPGMYTLCPITDEERVARRILLDGTPQHVLHVVDAKNLRRMLWMTVALIEAGFDMSLVLNMMDEAEALGVRIDTEALARRLGVTVYPTVALRGRGVRALREGIVRLACACS